MESVLEQTKPLSQFSKIQDIKLYTHSLETSLLTSTDFYGSSLEGQRSIADFFHMLDAFIKVDNANDYRLQKLDDERPVELKRSSLGNIVAGDYLVESTVEGGRIWFEPISTFFNVRSVAKIVDKGESARDRPDSNQSFKMRLIERDKDVLSV